MFEQGVVQETHVSMAARCEGISGRTGCFIAPPRGAADGRQSICKLLTLLTTLLGLNLAGCSTSIMLQVERPPTLNTSGIKRIAVMPFEGDNSGGIAAYATSVATARITEMNHFTLVSSSAVNDNRQNNENYVDALFVGEITRVNSHRDSEQGSYKDRDGNVHHYTNYITSVEIDFNYKLERTRDASLIGPVHKNCKNRAVNREGYPDAAQLLRVTVDNYLRYVGRDLAPYTATERRTFATDKTGNDALNTEMKNTLSQVKAGNYKAALEAYLGIYERYKSIAAAENASILYEALGDVKLAADLMQQVADGTGNPKAREVLARLNDILKDQETLATEYENVQTQADKVIAYAIREIRKYIPENGAKIWVYTPSISARDIADDIISDFINNGISVVDRANADLIEAEQGLQMSGAVNDDDIVGIGNATGASTIVILNITGIGAARRLQVKVLDVETRNTKFQSDTGERWQL